mgnify:CR=1 FL=1
MAGVDNRDLAYANAIEITREKTERGFIPNFGTVGNLKSRDRSQPPVGALVCREIYRRYREAWFLNEVFDDLFESNFPNLTPELMRQRQTLHELDLAAMKAVKKRFCIGHEVARRLTLPPACS